MPIDRSGSWSEDGWNREPPALKPGETFSDGTHEYTVEDQVGIGTFARAYKVSYPLLGGLLARQGRFATLKGYRLAKVLRDDDDEYMYRFTQEVKVLQALNHANVVEFHGTCELPNGQSVLLTELVRDAKTVKEYLPAHPGAGPSLILQALYALRAIHEAEPAVIHRDLSQDNLLVAPNGWVTLIDFGLARQSPRQSAGGRTRAYGTFGTPGYIAPEQRKSPANAGPRADLWSLGRLFGEAVTGRDPQDVVVGEIEDRFWRTVVGELTRYEPEQRPASARIYLERILSLLRAEDYALPPVPHFDEWKSRPSRAWLDYAVHALSTCGDLTYEDLVPLTWHADEVWLHPPMRGAAFFDAIATSEPYRFLATSSQAQIVARWGYEAGDAISLLLAKVFIRLDVARKAHCILLVGRLAVLLNRYPLMDRIREMFATEDDAFRTASLFAVLDKIDPAKVIRVAGRPL
ncbi:MAG: serine/threonine protein kinase [Labilithrix sp.]|nr:serine/threonine protein kinase [Labilithrix sp.]